MSLEDRMIITHIKNKLKKAKKLSVGHIQMNMAFSKEAHSNFS